MLVSTAVSFGGGAFILRLCRDSDEEALQKAVAKKNSMKAEGTGGGGRIGAQEVIDFTGKVIKKVYVACDAGMGSSAMGASILKDKVKQAGLDIEVKNVAIPNLPADVDVVVTHESLTERAMRERPEAVHISVDNFLSSPKYDEIVKKLTEAKNPLPVLKRKISKSQISQKQKKMQFI